MSEFEKWHLEFGDEIMDDYETLQEFGVRDKSRIELVIKSTSQSEPLSLSWLLDDIDQTTFRLEHCTYNIVEGTKIMVIVKSPRRVGIFIVNENSKIADVSKINLSLHFRCSCVNNS